MFRLFGPKRKWLSAAPDLLPGLALSFLFVYFSFFHRSALVVVLLILVLLASSRRPGISRELYLGFLSPFTPFVVTLGGIAITTSDDNQRYHFAVIILTFIFARLLRVLFSTAVLAVGIVGAAFLLGFIRLIGVSPLGQTVQEIAEFAARTDKNSTGWVLAFGLVAAAVLLYAYSNKPLPLVAATATFICLGSMLLLVDSMTALIAGAFGLLATFLAVFTYQIRQFGLSGPAKKLLLGGGGLFVLFASVFVFAKNFSQYFFPSGGIEGAGLLERDFETLTGRTQIWSCYLEIAVFGDSSRPWEDTQECSGFLPAHMHNIFLESHLIGGALLFLMLAFAFLFTLFAEARLIVRSSTHDFLVDHLFALGLTVAGLVVGLAESYVFHYLTMGALVLFLAARVQKNKWQLATSAP